MTFVRDKKRCMKPTKRCIYHRCRNSCIVLLIICFLFYAVTYMYLKNLYNTHLRVSLSNLLMKTDLCACNKWIVTSFKGETVEQVPGWLIINVTNEKKSATNHSLELIHDILYNSTNVCSCDYLWRKITKNSEILVKTSGDKRKIKSKRVFKTQQWIDKGLVDERILGYLLAIANGAKVIHAKDSEFNVLENTKEVFFYNPYTNMLSVYGATYFNPLLHFDKTSNKTCSFPSAGNGADDVQYRLMNSRTPLIQCPLLSNGCLDRHSPPVAVSKGVIVHATITNAVFLYDAFWALLMPLSKDGEHCQSWYSYWIQPLLWEIGGNLGFNAPDYDSSKSSTNNSAKERPPKIGYNISLSNMISSWTCRNTFSFVECAILWTKALSAVDSCNIYIEQILSDWIADLSSVGYTIPKRVSQKSHSWTGSESHLWADVIYSPPHVLQIEENRVSNSSFLSHLKDVNRFCNKSPFTVKSGKQPKKMIHNILLLIVFNNPFYDNIQFLELMYGALFSHIAYCGSEMNAFLKSSKRFARKVTFIEADVKEGVIGYRCMSLALKMNYNVDGYLFLSDDVLFTAVGIEKMPLDKFWASRIWPLVQSRTKHIKWIPWRDRYGKSRLEHAWRELVDLSQSSKTISDSFAAFKRNLIIHTGFDGGLHVGCADNYFIPSQYRYDIIFFFDHFARHNLFLEIAVHTTFAGLVPESEIKYIKEMYLWSSYERKHYRRFFRKDLMSLHPFKLSTEVQSKAGVQFLCEKFFPLIMFDN